MVYRGSEPTWGANSGSSPNPVAGNQAHHDYQQQAAQHFGGGASSPGPLGLPQQSPGPYGVPPSPPRKESFVKRLMERGVRGELIRQPWFQSMRANSADTFVIATYGGGFVISIMLWTIYFMPPWPGLFVPTLLNVAWWGLIGYFFFAVGSKLAHRFIMFGICLVGGLVMILGVFSRLWTVFGLLTLSEYLHPDFYVPMLISAVLSLLLCAAVAGFLIYVGLQVYQGVQRLSAPPAVP